MQIILLERVPKLGQMGEVVNVKPGYARNFLIPHGKALRATKASIGDFEKRRAQLEAHNLERKQDAQAMAAKVDGQSVTHPAPGERDQPALRLGQRPRHRRGLHRGRASRSTGSRSGWTQPLKTLGLHDVTVALHPEVEVTVKVNIARSQAEADLQAGKARPGGAGEEEERELTLEEELAALI